MDDEAFLRPFFVGAEVWVVSSNMEGPEKVYALKIRVTSIVIATYLCSKIWAIPKLFLEQPTLFIT